MEKKTESHTDKKRGGGLDGTFRFFSNLYFVISSLKCRQHCANLVAMFVLMASKISHQGSGVYHRTHRKGRKRCNSDSYVGLGLGIPENPLKKSDGKEAYHQKLYEDLYCPCSPT
eukprot:Hpha_TRINITY_DN3658_c0_g1::TRINITY_DN3658_c0_g1_i1::g.1071::m.1071